MGRKKKKDDKTRDYNELAPLSSYARFYFKYLGWYFLNLSTGNAYNKGDFWDYFNLTAKRTLLDDEVVTPDGFKLIKRDEYELILEQRKIKP